MRRVLLTLLGLAVVGVAGAWLFAVALPEWGASRPVPVSDEPTPAVPLSPAEARRIKATLFYVSADGTRLIGVEREVPYGATAPEQARQIIEEQIGLPRDAFMSPVPDGTRLRALFVTEQGDAFVDLSQDVSSGHTGGSLDELLTVYALVNALTVNLPAVRTVQILVEGREVETLAGHVDLRHPLRRNLRWVRERPTDEGSAGEPVVGPPDRR